MPQQLQPEKGMASSEPALWTAAINDQPEEVQRLLADGVNIDEKSLSGETALHGAVRGGFDAIVELLLGKGAGVNVRITNGCKDTALHLAARLGQGMFVELLLEKGAGVNFKNNFLDTALHLAARGGHSAIVARLLSRGVVVNYTNQNGDSALHLAVRGGHLATAILLLGKGADVLACNRFGKTPVDIASEPRKQAFAAALREEARRSEASQPGETSPGPFSLEQIQFGKEMASSEPALWTAATNGQPDGVRRLLADGVNIDEKSLGGETESLASAHANPELAAALREEARRRAVPQPGKTSPQS